MKSAYLVDSCMYPTQIVLKIMYLPIQKLPPWVVFVLPCHFQCSTDVLVYASLYLLWGTHLNETLLCHLIGQPYEWYCLPQCTQKAGILTICAQHGNLCMELPLTDNGISLICDDIPMSQPRCVLFPLRILIHITCKLLIHVDLNVSLICRP